MIAVAGTAAVVLAPADGAVIGVEVGLGGAVSDAGTMLLGSDAAGFEIPAEVGLSVVAVVVAGVNTLLAVAMAVAMTVAVAVDMRVGGDSVDAVGGAAAGIVNATVAIGVVLHELHCTGHSIRYCAASEPDSASRPKAHSGWVRSTHLAGSGIPLQCNTISVIAGAGTAAVVLAAVDEAVVDVVAGLRGAVSDEGEVVLDSDAAGSAENSVGVGSSAVASRVVAVVVLNGAPHTPHVAAHDLRTLRPRRWSGGNAHISSTVAHWSLLSLHTAASAASAVVARGTVGSPACNAATVGRIAVAVVADNDAAGSDVSVWVGLGVVAIVVAGVDTPLAEAMTVAVAVAMRVSVGSVDAVSGAAAGVADVTVAIGVVLHELHCTGHSIRYCAASEPDSASRPKAHSGWVRSTHLAGSGIPLQCNTISVIAGAGTAAVVLAAVDEAVVDVVAGLRGAVSDEGEVVLDSDAAGSAENSVGVGSSAVASRVVAVVVLNGAPHTPHVAAHALRTLRPRRWSGGNAHIFSTVAVAHWSLLSSHTAAPAVVARGTVGSPACNAATVG